MRDLVIFLVFLLMGCDQLRNQSNHISVECGISKDLVGNHTYVKLKAPNGTAYTMADVRTLRAMQIQQLSITPNACVIVQASGLVHAIDTKNGDSSTIRINTTDHASLMDLQLSTKPSIQVSFACSGEGLYASKILPQPMVVNFPGDASGLQLSLDLYSVDNVFVKTLYQKSMGETQLNLNDSIPVQDLAEGTYFLKAYGHHISEGFDRTPHLLTTEQNCRLNILKGAVKVGGLSSSQIIYPSNSQLPWNTSSSSETLSVCEETRSSQPSSSCEPQNRCKDIANFKKVSAVTTNRPGIFEYFVFGENRAGDRSPLSCQTVIVSDKAPEVSVSWKHEDLKKDGSILRNPYAILQASIEISHDFVNKEELEKNLTCRVDFEIKAKNSFSEASVICTEGQCKGKSMAQFTPCDMNVGFSIVGALNQSMLLNSRLRLTVRSNDGAGNISQTEKSVWINRSTWINEDLTYKINEVPQYMRSFMLDPTGDVIGTFETDTLNRLAAYSSGRWIELDPENTQGYFAYRVARARDHSLRIARVVQFEGGQKAEVFEYQAGTLKKITEIADDNLMPRCQTFLVGANNDLFCFGVYFNEAYRLNNNHWDQIPSPVENSSPLATQVVYWRVLADGRLATLVGSTLYIWNGTEWTHRVLENLDPTGSYDLIEDFKGRLWVYFTKAAINENNALFRIEGTQLIRYAAPQKLTQVLNRIYHPLSSNGLNAFTVGMQRFDFSTDAWTALPCPQDLEPTQSQINDSGRTFETLGNRGIFEENGGLLYWPIKSLGFLTSTLDQGIERDRNTLYFVDTTSGTDSLRRIRSNFVSSFDSKMLGTDDSFAIGSRVRGSGETDVYFFDGTRLTIKADRIEVKKAPAAFEGSIQVSALNDHIMCYTTFTGFWLYDETAGTTRRIADNNAAENRDCTEDKTGRMWWINTDKKTINILAGNESHVLKDFTPDTTETLNNLHSVADNALKMLSTNSRIVIFDNNEQVTRTLQIKDIVGAGSATRINGVGILAEDLVLINMQTDSSFNSYYLLNPITGEVSKETQYSKMVGNSTMNRVIKIGQTSYVLSLGPRAVLAEWKQGIWKKLGNINDYKPVMVSGSANPWWFTADGYGRLWFVTVSPYVFGRVDPEFVP